MAFTARKHKCAGGRPRQRSPPKQPAKRALSVLKRDAVLSIAQDAARIVSGKKTLFFCQSRALTESVAERMRGRGIDVFVHHSSVSLDERREDLGELLRRTGAALQLDDAGAHWWTFAGGRINHTLKYALEWLGGWKVIVDNFELRITGDGVNFATVEEAISRMKQDGFWDAEQTRDELLARLPEYRLSKFQSALPVDKAAELVGSYLLDFRETKSLLGRNPA